MSEILEISGVRHAYRLGFWMKKVEILKGITFSVKRKSIFGLLGANGAGKTTLIKLIAGLTDPTQGTVKISGIDTYSPEARIRIGYMPERPYFHEHLTGESLLFYMGRLAGMSHDRIEIRIPVVLELVGMTHAKKVELRKYSKGMLQRIGIAQAILHDPELVVFDEPMSGLDPRGRWEMRDLILKLASEGKSVFFSSHLIQDMEAICDEVAIIDRGMLYGSGPVANFLERESGRLELVLKEVKSEKSNDLVKALSRYGEVGVHAGGIKLLLRSDQNVEEVLQKSFQHGVKVQSLVPLRPTLEDLFKEQGIR